MLRDRDSWVSGYRLMWLLVMFDLPVTEPEDRARATKFRQYLLDEGFSMAQFSVYYRMLSGKEAVAALERRIASAVPPYGSVQLLTITDKQYENIRNFKGKKEESLEKPSQFVLL